MRAAWAGGAGGAGGYRMFLRVLAPQRAPQTPRRRPRAAAWPGRTSAVRSWRPGNGQSPWSPCQMPALRRPWRVDRACQHFYASLL